jgi:catechol 2,3-dioxygenase-like lactoylglutathione lyase family enzyme
VSQFDNLVITQVGIIVRDIEASVERYSRIFGVEKPPIVITDGSEKARTKFAGEPTEARAKLAFFKMGQVQIELIEPIGGPSSWEHFLEEKGEGVHHIAFVTNDTNRLVNALGQEGIEAVQQGHFQGGMYTYLDSVPELGVMLNVLQFFEK